MTIFILHTIISYYKSIKIFIMIKDKQQWQNPKLNPLLNFPLTFKISNKNTNFETRENVINSDYNLGSGLKKQVLKVRGLLQKGLLHCPAASLVSTFYGVLDSTHIPIKSSHAPKRVMTTELFVMLQETTLEVAHDQYMY